jgi:hypothetical protein
MIKFVCPTCETGYEVEIVNKRLIYISGNRRIDLSRENQDCENCVTEIEKEVEKAKEDARKKVKERKQYGSQVNI